MSLPKKRAQQTPRRRRNAVCTVLCGGEGVRMAGQDHPHDPRTRALKQEGKNEATRGETATPAQPERRSVVPSSVWLCLTCVG